VVGSKEEGVMEITDIRIRKVESEGKLKAYVTLTFDECFVVHNLKIISGQAGTFVAMPSRKTKKGEYKDIAHPINSDFRKVIQERILEEYSQLDDESGAQAETRMTSEGPEREGTEREGPESEGAKDVGSEEASSEKASGEDVSSEGEDTTEERTSERPAGENIDSP
jgi:stage V sporulation protein G